MNGRADRASYRIAHPQLKKEKKDGGKEENSEREAQFNQHVCSIALRIECGNRYAIMKFHQV